MPYPPAIQQLIRQLGALPAVGPKTAERYALFLLERDQVWLEQLAGVLTDLKKQVLYCSRCHSLSAVDPCPICTDSRRDSRFLCVVSETKDLLAVEGSQSYNGLYHVLGGVISAVNDAGPERLRVASLLEKLKPPSRVQEIILALNPDFDGEATALYLKKLLANFPQQVSRLARGLPTGALLDYADQQTIAHALKFRNHY